MFGNGAGIGMTSNTTVSVLKRILWGLNEALGESRVVAANPVTERLAVRGPVASGSLQAGGTAVFDLLQFQLSQASTEQQDSVTQATRTWSSGPREPQWRDACRGPEAEPFFSMCFCRMFY